MRHTPRLSHGGTTKIGWFDVSGFTENTNGTLTIGKAPW